MKEGVDQQVTIKFKDNIMYVWPGNMIRHVRVVNGIVLPSLDRRMFQPDTSFGLLGRLNAQEYQLAVQGYALVTDGAKLLRGIS